MDTPKWYETPIFKNVAGILLWLAIGYLGAKFGIQPTPPIEIKLPDSAVQSKDVHIHFDGNQPSVRQKE